MEPRAARARPLPRARRPRSHAQGLGHSLDLLGLDPHAGQFGQQAAGFGEADQRRRRAGHAHSGGRQRGALESQRLVAREAALVAPLAIVIGAFQGQRPQHGLEGLGMASGVARLAAAPTGPARADMVGAVLVEASLHHARRQGQHAPPHGSLQRLEVQLVDRSRAYEPLDLGLDHGEELLRAGFFFPAVRASAPAVRSRASHHCSLTSISSAVSRRKRRHSSIWAPFLRRRRQGSPASRFCRAPRG